MIDAFFNPASVAVIGASRNADSVGQGVLRNLVCGSVFRSRNCRPFPGKIFPVNPFADEILGLKCYPDLKSIQEQIDLAVICVPAKIVMAAVKQCIAKKVKAVIIVSAGFAEAGEEGRKLQDTIVKLLSSARIPLLGPNCLGLIRPSTYLNASFAPAMPPRGGIAFISQSGALADSVIDWAIEERYGFSAIISIGNKAMLDFTHFLKVLAVDAETKVIALYVEGINDGRAFFEVCKSVSRTKPIVVLKAGRSEQGAKAVSSHTASLAGSYAVFAAAMRQAGVIQADTVEELFDIAKALACQPAAKSGSIAIVTNGGGAGVLCADQCQLFGLQLAEIGPKAIAKMDASGKMHPAYSRRNPLDIVGDALPDRYDVAIHTLLDEKNIDGLIVIQTLQTMTNPEENAKIIGHAHLEHPDKPVVCVYMGGKFIKAGVHLLEQHSIPDYNDPAKAVLVMKALVQRGEFLRRNQ